MPGIEIVSATRVPSTAFEDETALGISLQRIPRDGLTASVAFENRRGLPEIYNERIRRATSEAIVFVHDDVWIEDYFFRERVLGGLERYDIIGVAGCRVRIDGQISWLDPDVDAKQLSGRVAHGKWPMGPVSVYGETPAPCELLDGVLLAARRGALVQVGVSFDPQFDFHFYDLDFCRSARQKGLTIGTWPICITHQSDGRYESASWQQKRDLYFRKWGS
jgi:GT2 family glycosyltransferase